MMEQLMGYIWLLWDAAAVLILAMFTYTGAARGLIRSLISFAGYAAAAAVAGFLSPRLADALYEGIVKEAIGMVILGRVEDGAGGVKTALDAAVPDGLLRIMDGGAQVAGIPADGAAQVVEELVEAAFKEPVTSMLRSLLFLLLFSLALLFVRRISRLFSGVYRIPLIGSADTLLGGVLGVLEAALLLLVISLGMRLLIGFYGGWPWLNDFVMNDTYIWRVFWTESFF